MAIDKDLLLAAIDAGRENTYGTDTNSTLGIKRAQAIEAYLGLNANPAPPGRSQVVDRTVFQTISVILPSLVKIFASSSDDVCKFLPVGPDDEAAAEQTTAVVHHVVTQMNQWEQVCTDWIHDACVLSNGYVMAYWDESNRKIREKYEGQSDDQVTLLMQDSDVTILEHTQSVDDEATAEAQAQYELQMQQWNQAVPILQAQGQPIPPQPEDPGEILEHDLVIEREENEGKVCLRVLPPEACFVDANTPNWTLQECRYFEVVQEKTIADLRAMGLDVSEDVSDETRYDRDSTLEGTARNRFNENDISEQKGVMRLVNARMIWVQADVEGDKQSRMYYVIAVGRTILYSEPCGRIPVSSMTPQPLPHRHIGMSLAEIVKDIQDTKTAIKRGGLDNLYLANNGRHVISSRVSLEDFLDARPGGVVRMLDDSLPAEGHIIPLTHPMAFDSIIGSLEYFDMDAQNRTGAHRAFAGTDEGAINRTAKGMTTMVSQAGMRIEHIARMMAPGVENLFGIVQEIIQKHQNKTMTIQLQGKWIAVDPQAWRTKRDVRISVGVGAGNKESMQQMLMETFAAQLQTAPFGLAGPEQMRNTRIEIAKLAGFANPDKFWKNDEQVKNTPPAPTPEQTKANGEMQQLQFKATQDQQKNQATQTMEHHRMMMQAELEKAKVAMDMEKARNQQEMEARQKQLELAQMAQIEEMKLKYQAAQAMARLEFDRWKVQFEAGMQANNTKVTAEAKRGPPVDMTPVVDTIQTIVDQINAPADIIRDANGRAVGVKKGQVTKKVIRDQSGRAARLQ